MIDALENENELVSTDEMKFPLMLYLQQVGMDRIRAIPCGIGSGMAKSTRTSGIFFAFEARNRHFWRLYTDDGELITDKRRLFRYLQAPESEKRVMPAQFEVYDALDKATKDVLKEINSTILSQRVPPKMSKTNSDLNILLVQTSFFNTATLPEEQDAFETLRQRVQNVIQHVPLEPFKRDKTLKGIP
ncbi:MAG UNVERIFIED_CONTAM: hypothetical protein LVT10_21820 [Anaerolineae bacterium]